jgi:F-type H+-transporting ATPase subunit b
LKEGLKLKRNTIILITVVLVLISAGLFWASAGVEAMAKWRDLAWRIINFIIFVGILYLAAGKRIVQMLTSRRQQIRDDLEGLDFRREEADKKLRQVEAQIKDLDAQREKILADFQAQGENLKKAILAQAEEKAKQIKAQAQTAAAQEYKLATEKLRDELSEMIIEAAEKMIQRQLTKENHEKLVQQSLTRVVLN